METDERQPSDPLADDAALSGAGDAFAASAAFLDRVGREPHRYDLFMTLRKVDCLHPELPRLGTAATPGDEAIRLGQEAMLTFAPGQISRLRPGRKGGRPWLLQRIFGLLGPNGALPTHLTEYAHERATHFGDATFLRFVDMLTHRVALLFYRAWAQAQPTVGADRPTENRHASYVGSICGEASDLSRSDPSLPHEASLFFAGRLSCGVRSADGLAAWIAGYLECPVRVEEFVLHWMPVESAGLTRIGSRLPGERQQSMLGMGACLGAKVRDAQHKFRVVIGPLDAGQYARFLPGGSGLERLRGLVRRYVGLEFAWDVRLQLLAKEVPRLALRTRGRPTEAIARLGFGAWLGTRRGHEAASDLLIEPTRLRH